jgi:Protein phosphatase 2C
MRRLGSITWEAFHLPRRGHAAEEYEDALAADGYRFAIADGASESSFAGQWSQLLVDGFTEPASQPRSAAAWLRPLRRRWLEAVDGLSLPWYAEAKRAQGAFATFLGLTLYPARTGDDHSRRKRRKTRAATGGRWRAVAIGDCCLFQVRHNALRTMFPLSTSGEFTNRPKLLSSLPGVPARLERRQGRWQAGDQLLLMTDALAHWFVAEAEHRAQPWNAIRAVLDGSVLFSEWVEGLRDQRLLRNDDVTLLSIHT